MDKISWISLLVALVVGVMGKSLWAYFTSGRVEKKAVYVRTEDCIKAHENCTTLEAYKRENDLRLSMVEKRLDEGREDFKAIRTDIGTININLAKMATILEEQAKG